MSDLTKFRADAERQRDRARETPVTPRSRPRKRPLPATPLDVTPEQQARIKNFPQHDADGAANADWLASRKFRFTGSNVAKLFGYGFISYQRNETVNSVRDAYVAKVRGDAEEEFDDRARQYMAWGNDHEDIAEEAFKQCVFHTAAYQGAEISHMGLYVSTNRGWGCLGASPDGILTRRDAAGNDVRELIEIKCPATWEKKQGVPTIYPRWKGYLRKGEKLDGVDFPIPKYYYCQVQYNMAVLGIHTRCHFIVWAPTEATGWSWTPAEGSVKPADYHPRHWRLAHTVIPYNKEFAERLVHGAIAIWNEQVKPAYEQHIESGAAAATKSP